MKKNIFEILLTIFCIGLVIQVVLMLEDLDFPISLLFGPILYLAYLNQLGNELKIRNSVPHFVPFIIVSFLFIVLFQHHLALYYHIYFISTLISMFIYPSIVIFSKKDDALFVNERNLILLEVMAILGFAIFFFINIIYINHLSNNIANVHAQWVVMAIIVICVSVLTWFLVTNKLYSKTNPDRIEIKKAIASEGTMSDQELLHIKIKVIQVLDKDHLYLDAHLTIEKLSKQIGICKEKIDCYIQNSLNSTFEEWMASYRIKHAVELIHTDSGNLKLEFLADLSGFDSRTRFNKYFKQFVGESPSNYRSKLIK